MKLTEREKWLMSEAYEAGWQECAENYSSSFGEYLKENESSLASEAPSDWISVNERLPEMHQHVVVMTDRYWNTPDGVPKMKVTATGYLNNVGNGNYLSIFGGRGMTLNAFTHWMPLPKLPERQE